MRMATALAAAILIAAAGPAPAGEAEFEAGARWARAYWAQTACPPPTPPTAALTGTEPDVSNIEQLHKGPEWIVGPFEEYSH